jgi:hypothetical protein
VITINKVRHQAKTQMPHHHTRAIAPDVAHLATRLRLVIDRVIRVIT